jgi:alpha/beta hydrolase fold
MPTPRASLWRVTALEALSRPRCLCVFATKTGLRFAVMYRVNDYHTPGTPSYEDNAEGYGLTRDTMKWFWDHYLTDPSEASNPYAAPLRARDLSGLPPAFVITAE